MMISRSATTMMILSLGAVAGVRHQLGVMRTAARISAGAMEGSSVTGIASSFFAAAQAVAPYHSPVSLVATYPDIAACTGCATRSPRTCCLLRDQPHVPAWRGRRRRALSLMLPARTPGCAQICRWSLAIHWSERRCDRLGWHGWRIWGPQDERRLRFAPHASDAAELVPAHSSLTLCTSRFARQTKRFGHCFFTRGLRIER